MTENESVKRERARKGRYLEDLGVTSIVVVDDEAHQHRVTVIGAGAPVHLRRSKFEKTDEYKEHGDGSRYGEWLEQKLDGVDQRQRGDLHRAALGKHPDLATGALDVLSVVFGDSYKPMDPAEWAGLSSEEKQAIANESLVLFDRNLGIAESGDDLAKAYLEEFPDAPLAVFTSKLDVGIEEIEDIKGFAGEVMVASKNHLTDVAEMAGFIDEMRLPTVAHHLQKVRETVLTIAEKAHKDAIQKVKELELRVLEAVMIKSSRHEGIFEGDTLIRLLTIEYQHAYRTALLADDSAVLHELLPEVEAARRKDAAKLAFGPAVTQIAGELMNKERYSAAEIINLPGLPIALGDIFRDDDDKFWMVVEPECDLQLRDDGDIHSEATHTHLVGLSAKPGSRSWLLPERSAQFEHPQSLDLGRRFTVPFYVLDLAMFRQDGGCAWRLGAEKPEITPLTPGIASRFDALRPQMEAIGANTDASDEILLRAGDMTGKREDDLLRWPLRRVERLQAWYASAGLVAVGSDRSRLALDHDFADSSAEPH